jgi:hypothetical protein
MPNNMAIKSDVMQQMVSGSIAEGSKVAVVASANNAELVLNSKQLALIGTSVKEFIDGEGLIFDGEIKKDNVAKAIATVLGEKPTYEWWELVRTTWEASYMAKYSLANEKSANNAWLDNMKRLKAKYALEKPAKGTKDSARMSESRAKEQAELQAKTDSVLQEEIVAYKSEGNSKATAKAIKLEAEVERRAKIANADKNERRKAQQSLLSKAMKKIEDDDLLNQIWNLVPDSVKLAIAQD